MCRSHVPNFLFVSLLCCLPAVGTPPLSSTAANWHQSSGPNGTWAIETDKDVPQEFSVRTGENVLWTMDLNESGQGGITVWKDRVFLTTMKPIDSATERSELKGDTIVALCVDALSHKVLWEREVPGTAKSPYLYGFSNSTTPAPITDGECVWFFNASGRIACFNMDGDTMWERTWLPVEELDGVHYPFNKQFEPILHGDLLINMETYWKRDGQRVYGWNYLFAIEKRTGDTQWISEDSLTHYNTPSFSHTSDGKAAMLIGRGGHHKVPENPKGYSLVDLRNGKSLWRYEANEGTALYNSVWNQKWALWFTEDENVIHKIDSQTGTLIEKISLTSDVSLRTFNTATGAYDLRTSFDSSVTNVFPAWYTNIIVGDHCWFTCFKKNRRLKHTGPEYCIGRVNLLTGKAEYLEVPVQCKYIGGEQQHLWHVDLENETTNIRGIDVAFDTRSKRDGWVWNFNPNPICVNGKLFFTTMSGIVYCIDSGCQEFDQAALISVNDLGPLGKTWTLNTPSFSGGRIYHRTSKQLICVGAN